jgi:SulP family sulfate permease
LVNQKSLKDDLFAGITNAIIVLPQGVAFAMIAGLPPIYGLYTAMIVPIVAALFGSSLHLISGPNTAVSIIFFTALSAFEIPGTQEYIELAFILTFLAGVIQFLMGLARMGTLINFVSNGVIVGFTAGAAILIISSQSKHILGIYPPKGGSFFENWQYIYTYLSETNFTVLIIASVTFISAILLKKLSKLIPGIPHLLLAMVIGSLLTYFVYNGAPGVELVGELPQQLPSFHLPQFTWEKVSMLTPNAFAVALLGLIQAIAIARSIAVKSQQNLDSNQEFIGEGLSNMVGSTMMCYASSGSFTRSGINYDSGAKTPMSAIFAAVSLAVILLLVAPLTAYLPIASMGGLIVLVGINLIDFKVIKHYFYSSKQEFGVLLITALSTLFLELQFAIYVGVILSLGMYLNRTSKPRVINVTPNMDLIGRPLQNIKHHDSPTCPQLTILRIDGSIFFGAIEHISKKLEVLKEKDVKNVLLLAQGVNFIDVSGADFLINQSRSFKVLGGNLYITGLKKNARNMFSKSDYSTKFGKENIFIHKNEAIAEIYGRLNKEVCQKCTAHVFNECKSEWIPITQS